MIEAFVYTVYGAVFVMTTVGIVRLTSMEKLFQRSLASEKKVSLDALPSVSVCIPARNESHAMTDCLNSVIASTYPKLEIIVLDDQSGDKTSSLIKAFAHDGIRFVEGSALRSGWLGKNHALNELLAEASGTYILYIDVDTRLQPTTIEQLVSYAESEKASMVSVLPRREDGFRNSVMLSPLRYLWTVLFHTKQRPAVASSAWLIHRTNFLNRFKNFDSMKDHIQPEATVAKALAAESAYRFLIGTTNLGVSYEKKWSSQKDTSIRLLYPLLGSQMYRSFIAVLALSVFLIPFVILMGSSDSIHILVSAGLYVYLLAFFAVYYAQVWRHGAVISAILWPLIVLQEIVFIILSTIRYQQQSVTWKGRPVRLPLSTADTDTTVQ